MDVGAKREMHALIVGAAARGCGVLICSTDLAELADLCDRVVVLQRGRVIATASGSELTESNLLTLMNAAPVS